MEPSARTRRLLVVVRHGETEWSLSGRHTGLTDIPLTEHGEAAARSLAPLLKTAEFALVLSSPLQRARRTCELAGLGSRAEIDPDLLEWNYGEYEGLTPKEILDRAPGWMIFTHGCPGGESPSAVGARIDRLIARIREVAGNVALFAHGHVLRAFAARWIGLPPEEGRRFVLDPSTISVLSYYRDIPTIRRWNAPFAEGRTS
jgi:probable phosphoglycerate mutase